LVESVTIHKAESLRDHVRAKIIFFIMLLKDAVR